jgi:hypothetical protein
MILALEYDSLIGLNLSEPFWCKGHVKLAAAERVARGIENGL